MARKLPELGPRLVAEIEAAWAQPQPDWARQRLLVVRLIVQHELTVAQIMRAAGVSRQTVFTYRDKVVAEGVAGLLRRDWKGARVPARWRPSLSGGWRPGSSGRRATRRRGS